jgi:L-arabinose isomerase
MTDAFTHREIWFVTGSQDLYGDDVLGQVADQSRRVAEVLADGTNVPVRIIWKPVLKDSESIRKTVLAAADDDACVGLIAWMHTFSPAKMWIRGLDVLSVPLLQLHTQANVELPWSTIDMDFMNLNQAAHGDREFGYVLTRMSVPRKIVVGHTSDPRVQDEVGTWARAAVARAELASLKLARFGDNMRNVAVTEGDKTEAEMRFGLSVNTWGVNDLADRVAQSSDAEVDLLVKEYEGVYRMADDLRVGGDRHDSIRYAARIELGLRSFLADGGFHAFTTSFEDLGELRQLPGLAVQRLMADGFGFGAEGDWKTAALVRIAKVMGAGLPGGASLMEDYTYDLSIDGELVLGAHMLEVCPSLTTSAPALEVHPLGIGGREDPARLVFEADPGPGVVVAMSDLGDRFRLVANVVDVVPSPQQLDRLPVGHAVWAPRPDLPTSAGAWLLAGAAHHTAMSTALTVEHLSDFARMTGVELLVIDDQTTRDSFEREVRWNAVYHRVAGGV